MGQKKSSRVVWRDDLIFTGHSSNGHSVPLDAAKAAGGHDAGISPMELLLTALGGCTGMDVISILRKKQQDVTGFEVQVEGERADEHPRVYKEIWVKFVITGRAVDAVPWSERLSCATSTAEWRARCAKRPRFI